MKPFKLTEAMQGKQVITRDGRPVLIAGSNPNAEKDHEVIGWVNGIGYNWSLLGLFYTGHETCIDLFMAPIQREAWVNIYNTYDYDRIGYVYPTEELAKKRSGYSGAITFRVTWEE